ncbi:flavodoxin [Proteinivorax tanatarense]|uniref:Flavodoxin n=1 Tax=Proteinivorax tanatarense TaxID=1260629 RepID=A0AAU7VJ77_9FIRM
MNKTLVVYYSLDGNCKLVAETLADNLDGEVDVVRIEPVKEITGGKFKRYFWGGTQVFMGKEPQIQSINVSVDDYSNIIIGTPVWAWTYSPPIRTFLKENKIKDKNIAMFCCHGGQVGKTLKNLARVLDGNKVTSQTDFFEPATKDKDENQQLIVNWAKELQQLINL